MANLLSANQASMETDVTEWDDWMPGSSSVVQSTDQAHIGTFSAKCTRNAVADPAVICGLSVNPPAAVAGNTYRFSAWFYTADANTVLDLILEWRQSDNTLISSPNSADVALTQNAWTFVSMEGVVAPTLTAKAYLYARTISGTTTGDVIYMDDVILLPNPLNRPTAFGTVW